MKYLKRHFLRAGALCGLVAVAALVFSPVVVFGQASVPIYTEQGGALMHIGSGGQLEVESGGSIDVESGGELQLAGTAVTATAAELNQVADSSGRIVSVTADTLAVTEALHNGKTIVLDRAGGIAVTLPTAAAGLKFRFVVKTTFTGAASIKSVTGADVMSGHAQMGNDSDNTTVLFQALAASTFDTINLLGTSNSTGGIEGQVITIEGLAANLWFVEIIGDAAGTEATPFENTVT